MFSAFLVRSGRLATLPLARIGVTSDRGLALNTGHATIMPIRTESARFPLLRIFATCKELGQTPGIVLHNLLVSDAIRVRQLQRGTAVDNIEYLRQCWESTRKAVRDAIKWYGFGSADFRDAMECEKRARENYLAEIESSIR